MWNKIIVPLDGSKVAEQILPYARLLAAACKAKVELLSVNAPDDLPERPEQIEETYLKTVAAKSFPNALDVQPLIEHGRAAEIIINRAKENPNSLIAMVTNGRSGIRRWLLGSVAAKVVQAAENPLLLVRATEVAPMEGLAKIQSIIVPLDGSELAESVLPVAGDLARMTGAGICLVKVCAVPAGSYYRGDDVPPAATPFIPSYDDLVADLKREAQEYFDTKAKMLRTDSAIDVRAEVVIGDAAEEIIRMAGASQHSLVAICTHGHSGVKRWVLGSVTEKVVNHGNSPMLIVRAR